jgi:carboxylate-amine ligase
VPEPRRWWWELRPHPAFGTLELRVPDAQATVEDAAAVAALVHALVGWLAARHDAGEPLETADTWRVEENRWSAARWGMDAALADLATGERTPARECLAALLAELAPVADRLGCAAELAGAERLGERNGAVRQREVAARGGGARAVTAWLADAYLPSGEYAMAAPGT